MNLRNILSDILRGAAVSLLTGLLVSIAHGGILWITLPAAAIILLLSVMLLQCRQTDRRQLRSVTAILLFLPSQMLYGKSGMIDFFFDLLHPAGTEVAIGDAVQMIFIILPGAFMLLLLAILLARIVSQKAAAPKDVTHAENPEFPQAK